MSGPTSAEGKAVSKWNATRHGISSPAPVVPGLESRDDWTEHRDGILESLSPVGALEDSLSERVALMLWRLHRVTRYETEAISLAQSRVEEDIHEKRRFLSSYGSSPYESTHPNDIRFEARYRKDCERAIRRYLNSQRRTEKKLKSQDAAAVLHDFYLEAQKLTETDFDYESVDVPGVNEGETNYEPPAMSASDVERGLEDIVEKTGEDLDIEEVLESALLNAELEARSAQTKCETTEVEVSRMKVERTLADEKVLEKVQKYESHLSRQLFHTLHELENLQSHRKEGKGTPLTRIDVQGLNTGTGD